MQLTSCYNLFLCSHRRLANDLIVLLFSVLKIGWTCE